LWEQQPLLSIVLLQKEKLQLSIGLLKEEHHNCIVLIQEEQLQLGMDLVQKEQP
jgi:hypothetical protein